MHSANEILRRHRLVGPLLASALLLLAACGGGDGGAPEAAQGEPAEGVRAGEDAAAVCELLTDDEVVEATGQEVLEKEADTTQLDTCEWTMTRPEGSALPPHVEEFPLDLVLMPVSEYESRTSDQDIYETLDGVGDDARFAFAGGREGVASMAQLYVRQGDQTFLLLPGGDFWSQREEALDALTSLAEGVLARL